MKTIKSAKVLKASTMTVLVAGVLASAHIYAAENDSKQELEALKVQVEALASALDEKANASEGKTNIGGYGELHFNNLTGNDQDQIDAHRFVIFVGHQFDDTLKLFSELEVEHTVAGEGQRGEVELEQAYIEKTLANGARVSMGQFLIPVGLINETHEPDTFYGVERNPMETNVIPATWWETGVMYSGNTEAFSYDIALHSALKSVALIDHDGDQGAVTAEIPGAVSIKDGRQKSALADANQSAITARIKGSPIEGLELAASYQFQNDISGGEELGIDANLITFNGVWQKEKFTVKAVYAMWNIDKKYETYFNGQAGAREQVGFTAEVAYRLRKSLGVFTRYSEWDNAAADNIESGFDQIDIGANYWLHDHVVLKADYQMRTNQANDNELNGINLGLGWSF